MNADSAKAYCSNVWLVDDDEMTNHINKFVLQAQGFAAEVRVFTNAKAALAELQAVGEDGRFPEFIFLDINMPVMDGWDFLRAYREFTQEQKNKCTVYILSSSIDEDDAKRAKIHEDVRDFISKPLNNRNLEVIKFQAEGP